MQRWLAKFNERYGTSITKEDIIRPYDKAIGTDGSIAVLGGNLAPEGAVIKHTACPERNVPRRPPCPTVRQRGGVPRCRAET